MKTINMQHEANIKAEGKLNSKKCKPIVCIDNGKVFSSVTDAAEYACVAVPSMIACLQGKTRKTGGKHFCYLSRVTESLDAICTRLRETAAVEEDAKKWKAYEAEQEAQRIAKEKHDAAVAKAKEKVESRRAICARIEAQLTEAEKNLMEAERELKTLEDEV